MATNITKVPLLRALQVRGYAQAAPVCGSVGYDVKSSVLANKLVVASADTGSPICRVSIQFQAGSRNETHDDMGATHMLRIAAGLSTKNATQFAIVRNIQQVGASLTCTANRETVAYTLEGTRQAVDQVLPYLTEVATQQAFKPWELADNIPRVRYELAIRPPQQRAVDLLHKAAYRRGLGNSIYFSKHQIGKISTETMLHYVANNCTSGRAAVVGHGIEHSQLTHYAQSLQLPSGDGSTTPSAYKGGEIRSDKGGDLAHVAIGLPRPGLNDPKNGMALAVLERAVGLGPSIKRGHNSASILGKAVGDGNYAVSALNLCYSDNGLFGVLISGHSSDAEKLVKTSVATLKNMKVSEEDVNRGKNQLKMALLNKSESGSDAVMMMGNQALYEKRAGNIDEFVQMVDGVTCADVNRVAKEVSSGKLSIAAVGNLSTVPFLDELSH